MFLYDKQTFYLKVNQETAKLDLRACVEQGANVSPPLFF